jgi:hypothetical protein
VSDRFDNAVEKATNRLLGFNGRIFEAFNDLRTGVSAQQIAGYAHQHNNDAMLTEGKAVGLGMAIAMITVESDRRAHAEAHSEPPEGEWTRDPEWDETVARQAKLVNIDNPPIAWRKTPMQALLGREFIEGDPEPRWHLSVAHRDRIPTWTELVDAAHALRPGVVFTIGLPPRSWWLNYDERVIHLWEIRDPELVAHWAAGARGDSPS